MQFFVMFIFGAVILGAGAMLAPALPTKQPRIGAAAALALALVTGGAVFWTQLFGYDPLVMDYLLFALVSGVVLGGTLSSAQARAEAKGEELPDSDQGWTGPQDLVFFALAAGLLLLTISFITIPRMETTHPIYQLLANYLVDQLEQTPVLIETAVGAVLAFLSVWAIYDVGSELRDKSLGRTMALVLLALMPILLLHIPAMLLMGLLYSIGAALFLLRATRQIQRLDMIAGGLLLGAALEVHLVLFAGVLIFAAVYALVFSGENRLLFFKNVGMMLVITVMAAAPWWLTQGAALFTLPDNPMLLWVSVIILPICIIGGWALLRVWQMLIPPPVQNMLYRQFYVLAAGGVVGLVGAWLLLAR